MANCETGCTIRDEHLEACPGECWGCLPVHTDWVVCHLCFERLGKALVRIGEAWNDLHAQVGKSSSYAIRDRVTGTPEIGLVLNEQVMDLMAEVRDWLLFVSRIVMTENDGRLEDSATFDLIKLLQRHIGFLVMHELAGEFVSDARRLASKVEKTAYPDGSRRVKLRENTCKKETDGVVCGGQLSYLARDHQGPVTISCKSDRSHTIEAKALV